MFYSFEFVIDFLFESVSSKNLELIKRIALESHL